MRLADLAPDHARKLLATALHLDRYNAEADIEMGLQYEAEGENARARRSFLEAYAVDHTYLPRWTLANYYFRRDNVPAFWTWARKAAAMPSGDLGPLFELCWRMSPDPEKITAAIANDKPNFLRKYIPFLLARHQAAAVPVIAHRLIRNGDPRADRPVLLTAVNALVAANDANAAVSLWRELIRRRWVVGESTPPNNSAFARVPLPVSFDWRLPAPSGMYSLPGASGLETEFSGSEPENCTVAEQTIALAPGNYVFQYTYQTSGIAAGTGIQWQIVDAESKATLASSSDLSSDAPARSVLKFSVPRGASLLRLRLVYRRAPETSRISGSLLTESTQIRAQPSA